jgi:ferredoxin-type protein NapG
MLDRKNFFKKGIASLFKTVKETQDLVAEVPVIIKETLSEKVTLEDELSAFRNIPEFSKSKKINKNLKPIPGAIKPLEKFKTKCNSCNDCISACPHGTIFPVFDQKENRNFPFLDPNLVACQLCKDTPCISSCNTGALKPLKKKESIKLGQVKSLFHNCLNSSADSKICTSCLDICPVEDVVKFQKNKPIFSKSCTGCGLCVQICPTFPKALQVK